MMMMMTSLLFSSSIDDDGDDGVGHKTRMNIPLSSLVMLMSSWLTPHKLLDRERERVIRNDE